ncbi:MAG: SAM-dependent methyltransferase, partial [Bryocella sp.]
MFEKFKKEAGQQEHAAKQQRTSRGWKEILEMLKSSDGLRVLDFGATSPANINYLTSLGHSVYMANVVQDSVRPEYWRVPEDSVRGTKPKPEFDA